MRAEFSQLYDKLSGSQSPIVFAHNDLLLGNIIYDSNSGNVTFIDYEYAECNYQAFDIGNHFAEFAGEFYSFQFTNFNHFDYFRLNQISLSVLTGMTDIDYSRYPNKEFQLEWLRVYLANYHTLDEQLVNDDYINQVYTEVNKFALVAHFLWAIWGIVQSVNSSIDYDFIE